MLKQLHSSCREHFWMENIPFREKKTILCTINLVFWAKNFRSFWRFFSWLSKLKITCPAEFLQDRLFIMKEVTTFMITSGFFPGIFGRLVKLFSRFVRIASTCTGELLFLRRKNNYFSITFYFLQKNSDGLATNCRQAC